MTHLTQSQNTSWGGFAAAIFAVAALSLLAALAGNLGPETGPSVERAAPAAPAEMPDWRGNSASLPDRD